MVFVHIADITAKGYAPVAIRNLPIFEGILSVQRTAMDKIKNGSFFISLGYNF